MFGRLTYQKDEKRKINGYSLIFLLLFFGIKKMITLIVIWGRFLVNKYLKASYFHPWKVSGIELRQGLGSFERDLKEDID